MPHFPLVQNKYFFQLSIKNVYQKKFSGWIGLSTALTTIQPFSQVVEYAELSNRELTAVIGHDVSRGFWCSISLGKGIKQWNVTIHIVWLFD